MILTIYNIMVLSPFELKKKDSSLQKDLNWLLLAEKKKKKRKRKKKVYFCHGRYVLSVMEIFSCQFNKEVKCGIKI